MAATVETQVIVGKTRATELNPLRHLSGLEFEKIHTAYRSMIGGLLARLWQGKCLEEIGQREGIDAALGIYRELLLHDGRSSSMLACSCVHCWWAGTAGTAAGSFQRPETFVGTTILACVATL